VKPSLATRYLGLELRNPLIASASPLNADLNHLRRLEDAGAAAVVLPSLFQEQIEAELEAHETMMGAQANASPEAQSYFPASVQGPYGLGPHLYLELIRGAREALDIPVIASLNGSTLTGWTEHAGLIAEAGASAIELNMYHIPTDLAETGQDIEARSLDIVAAVCGCVDVPVSVKLTPYLSAVGHFATELQAAGAAGLVLFNRLMEPDIDLHRMKLVDAPHLSTQAELRLPLLWTAILAGRLQTASLAVSSGVGTAQDVVKGLLAGADVVMTTSAILRAGPGEMARLVSGLQDWMQAREFAGIGQMRGIMSWQRSRDRTAYTRANYLRILHNYAVSG